MATSTVSGKLYKGVCWLPELRRPRGREGKGEKGEGGAAREETDRRRVRGNERTRVRESNVSVDGSEGKVGEEEERERKESIKKAEVREVSKEKDGEWKETKGRG